MSHYIHEIPGRLRIQSAAFRCQSGKARQAQDLMLAMDGVRSVRLNPRAGSLTVEYDPARLQRDQLLATLDTLGCTPASSRGTAPEGRRGAGSTAGALFGKALAGALVNKLAERSALRLVSVLL